MQRFKKLRIFLKLSIWLGVILFLAALSTIIYYGRTLPNYEKLIEYELPVTSRLYASDGALVDEFAKEKRSFVPIKYIPEHVIKAFIAAEDSSFYEHSGIDIRSIMRASYQNIFRFSQGKNFIGGSTITQQVVKNILLTKERKLSRKIKEAILAIRISKTLSKDRVLELYLNEIYLGYRSYGIAAAALNYFNKSLDDLSIAESAFLAALPKAPTSLDPKKNYSKALNRRNWVIKRMLQDGSISSDDAELAYSTPIILHEKAKSNQITAGSFSATVRKSLIDKFDERSLIEKGLVIHSTLDPNIQKIAINALRKGLRRYDKRHGYRGPITKIEIKNVTDKNTEIIDNEEESWSQALSDIRRPEGILDQNWDLACVLETEKDRVTIGFADNLQGYIALKTLGWAKKPEFILNEATQKKEEVLKDVTDTSQIFSKGDVILVEKKKNSLEDEYLLRQIPEINGAVVVLNPHNGSVLSMVGGYNDNKTEFNRAVQAMRQPGSIIKPFTYLAALENNFAPNTIIIDDEVRMKKEDGTYWVPMNYSDKFYGPTPLRIGLERSRNVVTVRLAEMVGLPKIASVIQRYGIDDEPLSNYAMILGASETNLLKITNAYAIIANGGKKITPHTIEKVQDKHGKTIYQRDQRECNNCNVSDQETINFPSIVKNDPRVTDERSAFQMISLLEGAVERGTGWRAKVLKKPIAGKTGTTNDSFDTWFVGFSSDIVVGVWTGFDKPRSLGNNETGSSVALPIFVDIMKKIQKDSKPRPFKVPDGVKFSKTDKQTGLPPGPLTLQKNIIFEVFKNENYEKLFAPNNNDDSSFDIDSESTLY